VIRIQITICAIYGQIRTCSTLPAAMTPRLTGAVALVPFTVMMAPDIAELV